MIVTTIQVTLSFQDGIDNGIDIGDVDFTAVSGTWTLKYNAATSKKLTDKASIIDAGAKMPSSVKQQVEKKILETSAN